MSIVKKIWIAAAVFTTVMIGFSVAIIQMSGYNTEFKKPVKKKMIMKCGEGKCGASMMEEVATTKEAK